MEEVINSAPRTATVLEAVSRNLAAVDAELREFLQPMRRPTGENGAEEIQANGVINHPNHRAAQDAMPYRREVDDELAVIRTDQQYQEDLQQTQDIAQMLRDQTNLEIPSVDMDANILEGYQQTVELQPRSHTVCGRDRMIRFVKNSDF